MVKNALILALIVLSIISGRATFKEMTMGEGGRDSSAAITGEARSMAFVANAVAGTVSVIDLENYAVVSTLDVTPDGKRVAPARNLSQWFAQPRLEESGGLNYAQDTDLSRDGTVLFVSRGFLGDVAAFDLRTGALLWRTPVPGLRADHMTLAPDGTRLYVSALIRGGNLVQVLDSATGLRKGNFPAGLWPHDVHVSASGENLYVASLGDMQLPLAERGKAENAYTVTIATARDLAITNTISFDKGVRPFAISTDEAWLFAQHSNDHGVSAYALPSGELQAALALPIAEGVSEADWDFEAPHHGLALTPDNETLCLAARASDYVAIAAAEPLALLHKVPVGDGPSWAALNASGELCVVTNNRSDDVSVISLDSATELARVPVGRAPKHVTVGRVPAGLFKQ